MINLGKNERTFGYSVIFFSAYNLQHFQQQNLLEKTVYLYTFIITISFNTAKNQIFY